MTKFKSAKKYKILVTSALPYANGSLHLGHLVEYIQVDIFVRFLRLIEEDVLFVCADDTHGAPIEIKADELGITPEKLIADVYKEHVQDFKDFLISFDNYYTTNSPENKHYSDLIFGRLKENGLIYTKDIEVTYCEHCKRTLPDRYVKGKCPKCNADDQYGDVCEVCNAAYKTTDLVEPYCAVCKNKPVRKTSKHYFFKLSKFSKKLESWIRKNKNLQPEIKNFVFNWIKNGLEDWNISRDGPYFGFKIPGEENKYYYVWLDAPIGYIASTDNYCKKHGLKTEDYWNNKNSRIYHFIGKDIIYFHFLFWPAMLLGSDFELPYHIPVHGFLTVNGEKMSKSRGTFFTAREFLQNYNAEYLRFYYASLLSKRMSDIDLNFNDFGKKINNELVANIGNFCYRVLNFLNKNFNGEIRDIDNNKKLISEIKKLTKNIEKNYYELNFNEAVKDILHISSLGNKYFQDNEPWKLINEDKEEVHKILGLCVNMVKNLSVLIEPVLPGLSSKLQYQLNIQNLKWEDINFELKNHKIGKDEILVRKIEEKEIEIKKKQKPQDVNFEVDEKIKELRLKFYVAQINNINVRKRSEILEKLKKEIEEKAKNLNLSNNKIYLESKKFYKNKSFEPPYAYLINLIKEKGQLPNINTVVDSYNIVSVKYLVSVGAHDTSKIKGNVRFKITDGSEKYIPLGSKETEKIDAGEYACVDDEHILCRLDIKQSKYTKVDEKTKNVLVYVQGNNSNKDEDLKQSIKEICENITRFCGGNYKILEEEPKPEFPLNLKVAKIIDIKEHPNADKLYILDIDLGTEKRQLVAGLRGYYSADDLKNKKIIVVTNLKYGKLRGVESQGMLLAGDDGTGPGLLTVQHSEQGDKVYFEGFENSNKELSFEDFSKIQMTVKNSKVYFENKELKTDKEIIKVEKSKDGSRVR